MNRRNNFLLISLLLCLSNLLQGQTVFVTADNGSQIELSPGQVLLIKENNIPQAYGIKYVGNDHLVLGNRQNTFQYAYSTPANFDVSRFSERQIRARRVAGWILVGLAGALVTSATMSALIVRSKNNSDCDPSVSECDDTILPIGIALFPVYVASGSIGIAGAIPLVRARSASRKGTRVTNAPFYFH